PQYVFGAKGCTRRTFIGAGCALPRHGIVMAAAGCLVERLAALRPERRSRVGTRPDAGAGGRAYLALRRCPMPEKETLQRARRDPAEGKSPSPQAGEFVREEIHHVRRGKHGARSPKQAIAIGLSKARRAGVKLPPPRRGSTSNSTRRKAKRDISRSRRS